MRIFSKSPPYRANDELHAREHRSCAMMRPRLASTALRMQCMHEGHEQPAHLRNILMASHLSRLQHV